MRVHLINPSDTAFGTAVITPRWLYVLAAATPFSYGTPQIVDETLDQLDPETVSPGDIVGIGIHTGNALRGYMLGRIVRERGATVVFGGNSIRPSSPRKRTSAAPRTPWSKATETWCGRRCCETFSRER